MGNATNKHGDGSAKLQDNVKVIVVGDNSRNLKTKFLFTYLDGDKARDYIPAVFDNTSVEVEYKNMQVSIGLWDTSGQEEFDRLRPLTYAQTDVAIILYNRLDEKSLANIQDLWMIPEVYHHIPSVSIIIVECEGDDQGTLVNFESAQALQSDPKILAFAVEKTSLKDASTIRKVFNEKALEAVEFSIKSGLRNECQKISESVNEQYGAELKKLKNDADAASKDKDESAKRKNEQYQQLLKKMNEEIYQRTMKVKREIYAKHFGWKY